MKIRDAFRRMQLVQEALIQIYREYRRELYTCALAIVRSPERAEDAVHEAFLRLLRSDVRPRSLKSYVFRAVRNAAIDQVRRGAGPASSVGTHDQEYEGRGIAEGEIRRVETGDAGLECLFDPRPGPLEAAADGEFGRRAAEALLTLSDDERETIVEHLFGRLTFREIAEARESSLGTVTAWYRRGLQKLRERLAEPSDTEAARESPTRETRRRTR